MIPRNLAAFELVELMAAGRLITTEQEHKLAIEIEKAPDEKLDEILIAQVTFRQVSWNL